MAPQYATSSLSSSWSSSTNQEQSIFKCICSYCCANNILFSTQESLRAHTRVLRTIFKVTFIVGIFFTVRVVVLLLRTLYFDGSEDPQDFPYLSYPLLFYQFPEFFPNILVVRGIAVSSYWSSLRATNANSDKLHVQIFQCLSMCYMGLICCDCCTESPEVSSHRNQDNAVNDVEEASFNSRTAGNNYSLAHIMGLGHEWDTEEGHVNPILSYTAKKNGNTSNAIPASSTNFHQEDTRSDGSACNASSVGSERLVHDPAFGRTSTMIYEEGTFGYRGGYRQSTLHGEEQYWEPQQTNPSHTQEQNVRSSFQLE